MNEPAITLVHLVTGEQLRLISTVEHTLDQLSLTALPAYGLAKLDGVGDAVYYVRPEHITLVEAEVTVEPLGAYG